MVFVILIHRYPKSVPRIVELLNANAEKEIFKNKNEEKQGYYDKLMTK